jgi:hypothetical protein
MIETYATVGLLRYYPTIPRILLEAVLNIELCRIDQYIRVVPLCGTDVEFKKQKRAALHAKHQLKQQLSALHETRR